MRRRLNDSFYDPFIYEACVLDELTEDGFMDERFLTEESLTDEMLDYLLTGRMDGVEDAVIMNEPIVFNGIRSTTYGTYVDGPNGQEIHLGGTTMLPPKYEVGEDYTPALMTLKWYFDYQENPNIPYIDIPVAEPIVPHSAKEKPISTDDLDVIMERKGGLIFDPTYMFKENRTSDQYVEFNPDRKKEMDVQVDIKMDPEKHSFLYTSRCNYIWHWNRYKVCALEFNPFHPLAAPYIESMSEEAGIVRGKYRWGRRVRDFYFNTRSKKYRLHYEVWGSAFSYRNHYLAVFDMVSNFDMHTLNLFSLPTRLYAFKPDYVVGGYLPILVDPFYSSISQVRRNPERQDRIMTYYSNIPVGMNFIGQKYYDITHLFELRYYSQLRWELFVTEKSTGKTIVSLVYSDKKSIHKQVDERLFISYTMKTSVMKVMILESEMTPEEKVGADKFEYLLYSPGCFFFGCPRNTAGSLIGNPSIIPISEYMKRMKNLKLGDPLEQMNCEIVDNSTMETALSPDELDRMREEMGNEYFDDFYDMAMYDDPD